MQYSMYNKTTGLVAYDLAVCMPYADITGLYRLKAVESSL